MRKKTITTIFAVMGFALSFFVAQAATEKVSFDASGGNLAISGTCSARFVLIVIRRTSDGSIWGSSNPDCVNGSYSYSVAVPNSDRTGTTFNVQAVDESAVGGTVPSSTAFPGAVQPVVFAAPILTTVITTATITIDTSSLATAPDDVSILDGVLQNFFGIVTSTINSIEASLVAATQIFAKYFTIIPGGSIAVPAGRNQISGQGLLQAGMSEVFIANTEITSSSQVVVTPTTPTQLPLAVTQITDRSGFDVGIISPQQIPVSFTWLIIGTYPVNSSDSIQEEDSIAPSILPVAPATGSDDTGVQSIASSTSGDVSSDTSSSTTDISNSSSTSDTSDDVILGDTTTTDDSDASSTIIVASSSPQDSGDAATTTDLSSGVATSTDATSSTQ